MIYLVCSASSTVPREYREPSELLRGSVDRPESRSLSKPRDLSVSRGIFGCLSERKGGRELANMECEDEQSMVVQTLAPARGAQAWLTLHWDYSGSSTPKCSGQTGKSEVKSEVRKRSKKAV